MGDRQSAITAEQVRVIYSQTYVSVISTPLAAGLLCLLQWSNVAPLVSAAWFACMCLISLLRLQLFRAFQRQDPGRIDYDLWGRRYNLMLLITGAIWGLASLIMFASEPRTQMTLMVIWIIGISAGGGISAYMVRLPTLLSFFVPVVLPGTIRLFSFGDTFHTLLGSAILLYCLVVLGAARRISHSMVTAIANNLELAEQIDERGKMEEALAQSHRQLQLITENIPACIALVDAEELKYRFVNRRHMEQTGHTWDEVVGRPVREVLGEDRFDFARPYIDRALSGQPASYVNQFTLQGRPRWVNVNYVPNRDETGRVRGIVVLTHDITESKLSEEALRLSEEEHRRLYQEANQARELYQSLLRSSPDSIVIYDLEGRVTFVNDAFVRTFGWQPQELSQGVPYTPESQREVTEAKVRGVVTAGQPVSDFETTRLTKDGREVDVSISASRFNDYQGRPSGMLVILRDISSRVSMERQLVTAKEAAEAANQAKSQFLANMSHELRTPLNAILGFAELLARDRSLSTEQRGNLQTIVKSGAHLLSLINDVLEFSKIEAGKITLQPVTFDLGQMLASIRELFQLRAQQKGIDLVLIEGDDLPRYIRADQSRLRQVLFNLLGNAVKFTDAGSVTLEVSRQGRSESGGPLIRFEVGDTGTGIAPAEQERVFEAFFQADLGQASHQGTGLGLPLSRRFVEILGGELEFASEVGRGSRFWFSVPVEETAGAEPPAESPPGEVVGLEPGQPEMRLLVVEDDPANRRLLLRLLRDAGLEAREAGNGQEAVTIWREWQPHLIFMDMRMPVMDGYEATQTIRGMPGGEEAAIVAITASAFVEDRVKVIGYGCDDFVRKPFRSAEVFHMLEKHLGARFIRQSAAVDPEARQEELSPAEVRARLASMPPELQSEVVRAVREVDYDTAMAMARRIEAADQPLGSYLADMVGSFRFDVLQRLIEGEER